MKSARIVKPKESLEIQDIKVPKPKGSQVLVKVLSAGVCHSDIHLWEGGYEGPEGQFLKTTDRGVAYPLTPGMSKGHSAIKSLYRSKSNRN